MCYFGYELETADSSETFGTYCWRLKGTSLTLAVAAQEEDRLLLVNGQGPIYSI